MKSCPTWFWPDAHALGYYRVQMSAADLEALTTHGWKQLEPAEHLLVLDDAQAMLTHGDDLPSGDVLELASRMRTGNRLELRNAGSVAQRADQLVPDDARPALRKWIVKTFGAQARKIGWMPGAHDSLDVALERASIVLTVAMTGRDPKLLASAVKLAAKWRDLPETARGPILAAAVLADPSIGKKLLAELPTIDDRREHEDVLAALTTTEDPDLAKALLDHLLDPKTDLMQEFWALRAIGHRPHYDQVQAFLDAHYDEVAPRMPQSARARMVRALTSSCDASKRDAIAAWAKQHIVPQVGGERTTAQAMEAMDQCIADKAALGPGIAAWLKKH